MQVARAPLFGRPLVVDMQGLSHVSLIQVLNGMILTAWLVMILSWNKGWTVLFVIVTIPTVFIIELMDLG